MRHKEGGRGGGRKGRLSTQLLHMGCYDHMEGEGGGGGYGGGYI